MTQNRWLDRHYFTHTCISSRGVFIPKPLSGGPSAKVFLQCLCQNLLMEVGGLFLYSNSIFSTFPLPAPLSCPPLDPRFRKLRSFLFGALLTVRNPPSLCWSTWPLTSMPFHGRKTEQGHWHLLGFCILLMLSREEIKVFTVTFTLAYFNWLLQHLEALALFSSARFLTRPRHVHNTVLVCNWGALQLND